MPAYYLRFASWLLAIGPAALAVRVIVYLALAHDDLSL